MLLPVVFLLALFCAPSLQIFPDCKCLDTTDKDKVICDVNNCAFLDVIPDIIQNPDYVPPVDTTTVPVDTTTVPVDTTTTGPVTADPKCECIVALTLACAPCDPAALASGVVIKNPLFVATTTVVTTTVAGDTTTSAGGSTTLRPNFVGHWDALSLWEQMAAAVPARAACETPWVQYEKRQLRKQQNKHRRRKYRGGNQLGGPRSRPCGGEKNPPLWY